MESAQQNRSLLLFKVGPYNFCAPVDRVEGVILPPVITTIPMAPPTIAGTFLFRDRAAVVVDMWQKLGLSANQTDDPGLLIVTSLTSGLVAFKVEDVSEIIHAETLKPYKLPFAKIYQLFEKFMLRGAEILLLTDFELLFASGEMGHLLNDLTELLNKRSIDTVVNQEVAELEANVDAKAVIPTTRKSQDLAEGSKVREVADSNGVSAGEISDSIADKPLVTRVVGRPQAAKHDRRPKVGADTKEIQVKKPPSHPLKHPAVIARKDKTSPRTGVIPPPAIKLLGGKFYVLGGLLLVVLLLLAGLYLYPTPASDGRQAAAPVDEKIEIDPPPQLPLAQTVAPEDTAAEKDSEVSEIKEPVAKEMRLEQKADSIDKAHALEEVVTPTINVAPVSQELLRVETDDFTLTVQRPVKTSGGLDTSAVSLPRLEPPQADALAKINPQRDIVHRVVKGDTLWDIAEKYLADPYRYKDLANLSRIHDPHWIYPGDIIHIIIKKGAKEEVR